MNGWPGQALHKGRFAKASFEPASQGSCEPAQNRGRRQGRPDKFDGLSDVRCHALTAPSPGPSTDQVGNGFAVLAGDVVRPTDGIAHLQSRIDAYPFIERGKE